MRARSSSVPARSIRPDKSKAARTASGRTSASAYSPSMMRGLMVAGSDMPQPDRACESQPATGGTVCPQFKLGLSESRTADGPCASRSGPIRQSASSDDVGNQIVFYQRNLIAQLQLTLFQAGDLQLVGRAGKGQRVDRRIQIAMLCFQHFQALAQLV